MSKKISCALVLVFFFFLPLRGEIKEIMHVNDIVNDVDESTLVVFDLDNTIHVAVQDFGGDAWFSDSVRIGMEEGLEELEAVRQVLPTYLKAQMLTKVEAVEEGTASFLRNLQDNDIKVLALTTRSLPLIERTFEQMDSIGVDFSANPPSREDFDFQARFLVNYRGGILFNGDNNKGEVLAAFLKEIGYHPKKIVFVDDKRSHVEAVGKRVQEMNIPYIGFRYGAMDERVRKFNRKLADIQQEYMENLMSDEMAHKLLKEREVASVE